MSRTGFQLYSPLELKTATLKARTEGRLSSILVEMQNAAEQGKGYLSTREFTDYVVDGLVKLGFAVDVQATDPLNKMLYVYWMDT